MYFEKLGMSKKLLIPPLVVILFLGALAYVSYHGLGNQKIALEDIFGKRFKGSQSSSRILIDISNVHTNIYRVISWTNAKFSEKKIAQLAQEQVAAMEQIVGFMKNVLESDTLIPEEKQRYQVARGKLLEYQKAASGVLDVVSSDLNIATMYMGTADDKFLDLNKNLLGLIELENKLAKDQYDSSSQNLGRVIKIFITLPKF